MADESLRAKVELLSTFAGEGSRHLEAVVSNHAPLLEIWATLANRAWMPEAVRGRCCQAIAASPADLSLRRAAAIDVLQGAATGQLAAVPAPLSGLLDAATFPALREIVNQAGSPASCNFPAASHLAHCGDSQIAPKLAQLRAGLNDGAVHMRKVFDWFAWQIEVQNPPGKLLEHIASGQPFTTETRAWALRGCGRSRDCTGAPSALRVGSGGSRDCLQNPSQSPFP